MLVAVAAGLAGWMPRPLAFTAARRPPSGGLEGASTAELLAQLERADASWTPRVEQLPDGRTRYHVKRRKGDPELSLEAVRALLENPPRFEQERAVIQELLRLLSASGVRIQLAEPRKPGAAGEWDPAARSLRLRPSLLQSGSREFAQVLNHEAIHVAQSCRGGGVTAKPKLLGLGGELPADLLPVLQEPLYTQATPQEQQLEREAYANQRQLELGGLMLRSHCRV